MTVPQKFNSYITSGKLLHHMFDTRQHSQMEPKQFWQLRCFLFLDVVGLNSPGSNTQSIILSVPLSCIIFSIWCQVVTFRALHCQPNWVALHFQCQRSVKGSISLILIGVTRVKAKIAELMLFLILFLYLPVYIKPFNFWSGLYYNWEKRPIF